MNLRNLSCYSGLLAVLVVVSAPAPRSLLSAAEDKNTKTSFERDVLPILKDRCFKCHSGPQGKADLDLTARRSLLRGGLSGAAVRRGAAEFSLLWERIASGEMPAQGPPLTAEQKGIIRTWINEGALGNDEEQQAGEAAESAEVISEDDRGFWSFQTPRRPSLPQSATSGHLANPIDSFLMSKLAEHGLSFSEQADRATLLRRVSYDLIGLPPTPEQVQQFIGDASPDAYERLIDRLLASPRYGERWGRHWLDLAGYADSAGILNEDRPLPLAYRYRDYVIRAFNKDKPYDRFLQEQIAGDELAEYWPHYEADQRLPDEVIEGLTATGFLRCAADSSRPDFSSIKNADALYFYPTINDTIQIVATSTLGLTLQCARCHHHMYDPIPQEDFYRVQAILMSALRPSQWIPQMQRRLKVATKVEEQAATNRNKEVAAKVKGQKQQVTQLRQQYKTQLFDDGLAQLPAPIRLEVKEALAAAADSRTVRQQQLVKEHQSTLQPDDKQLSQLLPDRYPEYKRELERLNGLITATERRRIQLDEIRALYDLQGEVPTPFLRRGDALTPGRKVSPGTLSVLDHAVKFQWEPPAPGAKTSGRRLAFARWLTHSQHPLTARVMVNRIWLHHFGEGIVSTPGDFGRAGATPSHPELLDWLAREFVASGWSIKQMHRLILTSTAYRQRSLVDRTRHDRALEVDPDNRLLWRQQLRRLEAEALRDSVLCVAGTLNEKMFGPPISMQRRQDGEVTTGDGQDPHRRSAYLQILRLTPLTMLQNFDQPVMETNCIRRSRSTVSTQALTLLNSSTLVSTADAFAGRVLDENPADPVARAVWLAFSRAPAELERRLLDDFLSAQTERYCDTSAADSTKSTTHPPDGARRKAVADMCHMLLSANEFTYVD